MKVDALTAAAFAAQYVRFNGAAEGGLAPASGSGVVNGRVALEMMAKLEETKANGNEIKLGKGAIVDIKA